MAKKSPHSKTQEVHAIARGNVQGVFFRATTQEYAREMGIVGTVRNKEDGSVDICAQGPRSELETFLQRLKDEPGMGTVEEMDIEFHKPEQAFEDFHIVYW